MGWKNLTLAFEQEQRLALLTVNRPEKRNALDGETVDEMHRALDEVAAAGSTVLIVTGAGEKSFVAGADIAAIRERRRDDALASINSRLMTAVEAHPAVSIAAVNGWALGGGHRGKWREASVGEPGTTDCGPPRPSNRSSIRQQALGSPHGSRQQGRL
jgi:enoyl-CoA hydratase